MQTNSPSRAQASRLNGAKGKGAVSEQGKARSRLNALKDGLFAEQLVIASAGEREEDYEKLRARLWDYFKPCTVVEEMLVDDVVANWWRRQRIRRCEKAAVTRSTSTSWIRDLLRRTDAVESLKVRFIHLCQKGTNPDPGATTTGMRELEAELDQVRMELSSTSLGLEFLIKIAERIEREAASAGQISVFGKVELAGCGGAANPLVKQVYAVDMINRRESAKQTDFRGESKEPTPKTQETSAVDESAASENRKVLTLAIQSIAQELRSRLIIVRPIERAEEKALCDAPVLPAAEELDRLNRAETAVERRLYKALSALLSLRKNLPPPNQVT